MQLLGLGWVVGEWEVTGISKVRVSLKEVGGNEIAYVTLQEMENILDQRIDEV